MIQTLSSSEVYCDISPDNAVVLGSVVSGFLMTSEVDFLNN